MPCFQSSSPYQGFGPTSGPHLTEEDCLNACKEGACCESDGTCNVRPQCQCQGATQTFRGIGTTCEPNPCLPCNACCALPCAGYGDIQGCGDLHMDIAFAASASTATNGNESAPLCTTLTTDVPATSSSGAAGNSGCLWSRGSVQSPIVLQAIQSSPNADAVGADGLYIGGFTAAHYIAVRGSVLVLSGCKARLTLTIDSWYIGVARYSPPLPSYCGDILAGGYEEYWLYPQYAGTQNPYVHSALPDYEIVSDISFQCISELAGAALSVTASFPRYTEAFFDNFFCSGRRCSYIKFFNEVGQPFANAGEATLEMSIASLGPLP